MADIEIPEGELLSMSEELKSISDGFNAISGSAESLEQGTGHGMPGSNSVAAGSQAGRNVDQRITHYVDRLRNCADDIADLDGVFQSLDAYHENQFIMPQAGDPSKPI